MAGDFIQWTIGLVDKREVAIIASILRREKEEIASRLMRFWEWCDSNIPEESINPDTLDAVIEMSPEAEDNRRFFDEKFGLKGAAKATEKAGWIAFRKSKIIIPAFGRHNGSTAKTRARNTKNKRNSRKRQREAVGDLSSLNGDTSGQKRGHAAAENREQRGENREESNQVGRSVGGFLEGDARGRPDGSGGAAGGDRGGGGSWELAIKALSRIKTAHLGQPSVLTGFHRAAHHEHPSAISADEPGLLRIFAAAVHAVRFGKRNKSGMFAWLVSNPSRAKFDGDDAEQAVNSLRSLRQAIKDDPAAFSRNAIPLCDEVRTAVFPGSN
jgi:hypothetical protein